MEKAAGQLAELEFLLNASKRSLLLSQPYGDNEPYDFIVDNGIRLFKVQVKSTSHLVQRGNHKSYQITCRRGNGTCTRSYHKDEIDLIAAYIAPMNVWYVIPYSKVKSNTLRFYPHTINSKGFYESFKEDWEAFHAV